MRPGAIEGVARRRLGARRGLAGPALLLAALASRAGPIDGFPLFGFRAVVLVVVALALAAPLLVRAGAALPGRILGRALGPSGRLGAGFFGGALAKNGIAVTALAMALGMTLAMIVTVASIRRDRARLGRVDAPLRPLDQGGRRRPQRNRRATSRPMSSTCSTASTASTRWIRFGPATRRTRRAARSRSPLATSACSREPAACPSWTAAIRARPRPEARASGEVLVSEPFARRFSAADGSTVTLPTPSGPRPFRVAGVYRDYSNDRGTVVMDRELYLSIYRDPRVTSLAVLAQPGVEPAELRRRVLAAAAGRYALTITTNRELRREVLVIFDRTFAVTRALEAIAVAVAVLGIANALMASAVERRRAFGLLRAVGASGEQIRRATFVEALLCGLTGTLAALAAGAAFAWLLLTVINPQSFGWTVALAVPDRRSSARRPSCSSHRCWPASVRDGSPRPWIPRRPWRKNETAPRPCRRSSSAALSPRSPPRPGRASPRPRRTPRRSARVVVLDGTPPGRRREGSTVFSSRSSVCATFTSPTSPGRTSLRDASPTRRRCTSPCPASPAPPRRASTSSTKTGRRATRRERQKLRVRTREGLLTLTLSPAKPPVLHGEAGISRKGPGPDEYSHYVSITRLNVSGTLRAERQERVPHGTAWFDHEWGPGGLPAGIARLGLVRARARGRLRAHALPDAPDRRPGFALFRGHVRSGVGRSARDRVERRPPGAEDDVDLAPIEGGLPRRLGARGRVARPRGRDHASARRPGARDDGIDRGDLLGGRLPVAGRKGGRPIGGRAYVEMTGYAGRDVPGLRDR